jgi:hypothetical protein
MLHNKKKEIKALLGPLLEALLREVLLGEVVSVE